MANSTRVSIRCCFEETDKDATDIKKILRNVEHDSIHPHKTRDFTKYSGTQTENTEILLRSS